jgi:hypothetical protein
MGLDNEHSLSHFCSANNLSFNESAYTHLFEKKVSRPRRKPVDELAETQSEIVDATPANNTVEAKTSTRKKSTRKKSTTKTSTRKKSTTKKSTTTRSSIAKKEDTHLEKNSTPSVVSFEVEPQNNIHQTYVSGSAAEKSTTDYSQETMGEDVE